MSPAARFVLQMTAVSVWVLRQVSVLLSSLTADWIQNGCSECVQGICSIRQLVILSVMREADSLRCAA